MSLDMTADSDFSATDSSWSQVDTGALSWLVPEISQTLDQSLKCLTDFSANTEDGTPLRMARSHLHQAHGALQVIDLEGVSLLTETVEHIYDAFEAQPAQCSAAAVQTIGLGFRALNEYLAELMGGAVHQPMRLFPSYRALLQLKGAERIHPSDLFFPDLSIRPPQPTAQTALTPEALAQERVRFEGGLLRYLRNEADQAAISAMSTAISAIESAPKQGQERAFWWISRAFFEALKAQSLPKDEGIKRLTARINLQIRRLLDQSGTVSERVLRDTLFFVAQAKPVTDHIRAVQATYKLDLALASDYEVQRYGHVDSASIRQAKDLVSPAKKAWSGIVGGNLALIPDFAQHANALLGLASQFEQPGLAQLALVIANIATDLSFEPRRPEEQIGLDVAGALLFLESALDQIHALDERFEARAMQLVGRLDTIAAGLPADQDIPWLDEITRRAHERQAMDQFIVEMQANLNSVEKSLDAFFRDPDQNQGLQPAEQLLAQLSGVLFTLGHEQVAEAVAHSRQAILGFADADFVAGFVAEFVPEFAANANANANANASAAKHVVAFERLAHSLSAIGFYIEHMQHPAGRGMLFRFDEQSGHYTADLVPLQQVTAAPVPSAPDVYAAPAVATFDVGTNSVAPDVVESVPETTLEQQIAESGDAVTLLADALRENPDDVMARDRLLTKLEEVRSNAELIDDNDLRANASAAIDLLENAPDEGAEVSDIMSNIRTGGLTDRIIELTSQAHRLGGNEAFTPTLEPTVRVPEENDVAGIDAELLEIFLDEAQEVLQTARTAWNELNEQPANKDQLVTMRRAFHTLKGSGRMVGLMEFGEAGWAIEQTLNQHLSEVNNSAATASSALMGLLSSAIIELEAWVAELQQSGYSGRQAQALVAYAEAVREGRPYAYETHASAQAHVDVMDDAAHAVAHEVAPQVMHRIEPVGSSPGVDPVIIQTIDATAPLKLNIDFDLELTKRAHPEDELVPLPDLLRQEETKQEHKQEAPTAEALDNSGLEVPVEAAAVGQAMVPTVSQVAPPQAESVRQIGHLTIGLPLYNIFLAEADELLRTLGRDFSEWRHELHRTGSEAAFRAAHSLAGSSSTVGLDAVHDLAGAIERVLLTSANQAVGLEPNEIDLLDAAVDSLRAMLHNFAAQFLPEADAQHIVELDQLRDRLALRLPFNAMPLPVETPAQLMPSTFVEPPMYVAATSFEPVNNPAPSSNRNAMTALLEASDVRDDIDTDLLAIFIQEANDILPQIGQNLRDWQSHPARTDLPQALLRQLHTVKGSSRMAGAMRLGELMHAMETRIDNGASQGLAAEGFDDLLVAYDYGLELLQLLANPKAAPQRAESADAVPQAEWASSIFEAPAQAQSMPEFERRKKNRATVPTGPMVRVRADLLDRVVNQAGEVSITRARLDNEVGQIRVSLSDLTDNLARLRSQLREIEMQAESQMQSQLSMAKEQEMFDPLEFDRFTRFQELTRMMAESVNDVEMVRKNLMRSLDGAGRNLSTQKRMTRDMQQDLMRVRMVPFSSVTDRLYRVVRQASKELDKRANLDIIGSNVEMDRALLEQMAGPFEHLLRNAVVHGIEMRETRRDAGKQEIGELVVEVRHEGNEIVLTFSDDGGGLNLPKIRERAVSVGLIQNDENLSDERVADLVFQPGLSTASHITELAGRGVGMDVVRQEAAALGGRVTVTSQPGQGTRFTVHLPLTLAVTQAVVVRVAGRLFAMPAVLVEAVQQVRADDLSQAYLDGQMMWQGKPAKLHFLARLLGDAAVPMAQRLTPVLIVRSSSERIALHVDEVIGNQEAVVKNLGPQLARMVGIAGATVLGTGEVVLILNPVQIAQRLQILQTAAAESAAWVAAAEPSANMSGEAAISDSNTVSNPGSDVHEAVRSAQAFVQAAITPNAGRPSAFEATGLETMLQVMVVDDSLTVRRVTQRLLMREGYQVVLAKDGIDALQQMEEMVPDVMLVDIEMPRMDGFDLTRHIREDERYKHIPIIMITSRTADKHRTFAMQLGVNVYLGKPYQDDELVAHIRSFVGKSKVG